MKDALISLINALFAGEKQLIVDTFAAVLEHIFEIVKINM